MRVGEWLLESLVDACRVEVGRALEASGRQRYERVACAAMLAGEIRREVEALPTARYVAARRTGRQV